MGSLSKVQPPSLLTVELYWSTVPSIYLSPHQAAVVLPPSVAMGTRSLVVRHQFHAQAGAPHPICPQSPRCSAIQFAMSRPQAKSLGTERRRRMASSRFPDRRTLGFLEKYLLVGAGAWRFHWSSRLCRGSHPRLGIPPALEDCGWPISASPLLLHSNLRPDPCRRWSLGWDWPVGSKYWHFPCC